jgi:hypothetical protein
MLDPNGGDGEHHDSTKCKKDCCCCRKLVANKKNIGAKWANYLDKCKTPNPCKLSKPIQKTLFKNKSSIMEKAHLAANSHRGWRSVSWARFQLEQKTNKYRNKQISQGDLFTPPTTRCGNSNNGLTLEQFQEQLSIPLLLASQKNSCRKDAIIPLDDRREYNIERSDITKTNLFSSVQQIYIS